MVNLNDAVLLLRAKRQELLDQLDAVDKALAALSGVGAAVTPTPGRDPESPETPAGTVLPTRLKARKRLSDEHKHALSEGRRRARHAKDAAAGLARELPEPPAGLPPAPSAEGRPPRLIKRMKP
jgi:hypothetical protein